MNDINSIFEAAGLLFGSDRDEDKLYVSVIEIFSTRLIDLT